MNKRSTPFGRIAAALAAAILAVLAGCSSDERPKYNGKAVDNAAEVLTEAENLFVKETDKLVQAGLAAYSDQSRCYFQQSHPDSKQITSSLRCGPVRVLGEDSEHNWYALRVRSRAFPNETTTSLGVSNERLGSLLKIDGPDGLYRPDGLQPAPPSSVQAPQADPFPVSDFAVLIDRETLELDTHWRWYANRYEIKTPGMSMTFDASGALKVLPGEMTKALVVPSVSTADVDWYLPPKKRHVRAWQVTIRATDTSNTGLLVDSGPLGRVVGKLPCREQPCQDPRVGRYYLVATGLGTERPELIVQSGDGERFFDLATGRELSR